LTNHPPASSPNLAVNLLSILERLATFPTEQSELNAWWVIELGAKPPKPKKSKKGPTDAGSLSDEEELKKDDDDNENDDWRKFFEDEPVASEDGKTKSGLRLHQMTVHQSLHSLASHRAVFTRAWLSLLPRLSDPGSSEQSKALAVRALNLMHRGVLPHLTRPILVMDWIGSCVDLGKPPRDLSLTVSLKLRCPAGGSVGLLALNALFVLMKDYNLFVEFVFLCLACVLNLLLIQRLSIFLSPALRLPRP
jgi:U3 small nucleolar RNA-associated protein 19